MPQDVMIVATIDVIPIPLMGDGTSVSYVDVTNIQIILTYNIY